MISGMLRALSVAVFIWIVSVAQGAEPVDAVTKASQDRKLSFNRPGRILELLVKEGQTVKAQEVLVRQDDRAEQVELDRLKAQATDDVKVRAAIAQLEQKKADLAKIEEAARKNAATPQEVEHARLDVTIGDLSVELAKFEHAQDKFKADTQEFEVLRMRIVSPFAGTIQEVFFREGEAADALKDVIRVVNLDPLWVDAAVPRSQALCLHLGDTAEIAAIPDPNSPCMPLESLMGKVTFIAPVGDSASDTIIVRLEAANPGHRPAGEHVKVHFPGADKAGPAREPAPTATTQPIKE